MRDSIFIKIGMAACGWCFLALPVWGMSGDQVSLKTTGPAREATGILVAAGDDLKKDELKKAKKGAEGRRKILTGEAAYKNARHGQKTSIDFDEAQIDGSRKTPTGVAITKNRPDQEFDLINLRLSWHPEMKESTTRLETGKGR